MTLNLKHLEELYKNATQGEWTTDSDRIIESVKGGIVCSMEFETGQHEENRKLIVALHNALPKILKTIRAYEEMVENVRGMEVQGIDCEFWGCEPLRTAIEARRDSILKYLDEKLKEIE